MRKSFKYMILAALLAAVSCEQMNLPTKDKVSDDDIFSSASSLQVYMARMYSYLPIEDFKYLAEWGVEYNSWLGSFGMEGTGEAVNRDCSSSFTGERTTFWSPAFSIIHDANHIIETAPLYEEALGAEVANEAIGQGYFVRAFTFYAMARRFGGIPLVTKTIDYDRENPETMEVPRASEEETWDQIARDFDEAAKYLPVTPSAKGYANKYTALAVKAEAMNYAGCVAKYNETVQGRLSGTGEKTGVRVMGFDASSAAAASKRYFEEAFKAANEVIQSGTYSLYRANKDKYQNMVDMWRDDTSSENIWVRYYSYPTLTHGLDSYSSPCLWHLPLSGGTSPTLDFVELFDGLPRYADGTLRVTDGADHTTGNYILFDSPYDIFANAEPRLRAYVILPMDKFRGETIETRMGIYKGGETTIKPLGHYAYGDAGVKYAAYGNDKIKCGTRRTDNEFDNDAQMTRSGSCGPFADDNEATTTGFHLRKYLNPDMGADDIGEGKSDQPFILMRYADVLLAAAEAGVELALVGETSVDGTNVLSVATEAIADIRDRAGADPLAGSLTASVESRNIVRRERRKELAFEHKSKWDIRRWRVIDEQNRDGFWGEVRDHSAFSDGTRFHFRGLYPFYSTSTGKYFLDARYECNLNKNYDYNTVDYYFAIPSDQVSKSSVIDQQPNR